MTAHRLRQTTRSLLLCSALAAVSSPAWAAPSKPAKPAAPAPVAPAAITTPPAPGGNGIAAVVNGRPILWSDVEKFNTSQEMMLRATTPDRNELEKKLAEARSTSLETLVEQELILKEFEPYEAGFSDKVNAYADEGIKNRFIKERYKGDRAAFLKDLNAAGLSYKKFYESQRRGVIMKMMEGQNVKVPDYITSDERDAFRKKHESAFREGDEIKLWSITIPKVGTDAASTVQSQKALAKEIRTKLVNGDDFASLARTYSQDSKAGNGGDWGFVSKKGLSRYMADLVFSLTPKKVSEVMDVEDSYYIFYVEAVKPGQMRPKEEIDAAVENGVMEEKRKKAYEEWVTKLKRKATIRYGAK